MRAKKIRQPRITTQTVIMDGGYNENISSLELKGGELYYGKNYYLVEGSSGGYVSTKGYERYDGQPLASTYDLVDRETERAAIDPVPGSGDVLGLHMFKGVLYAFRDNAGNTATDMYKATASGWEQIDLGSKITFSTGATSALTVGETLTGGTSTATGTLLKVVITSGTVAGGDAAGYVIIDVLTGTFQSAETLTGGTSSGTIVSTSLAVDQTITKEGSYHFVNHNFYATSGSEYMYFTNGVNKAMVFDGTALDFIDNSGMDPSDTPINIIAHNDRIFLAYEGGSLQYSTLGDPEDWTTNPGELGMGQEITGLYQAVGNALIIFCETGVRVLQGTSDSETWQVDYFAQKIGAYEFTPQRMFGKIMFMNNRGVSTLDAVQEFGDFAASTISEKIYDTLQKYKGLTTTATVHRELNQYRVWFSNGMGVVFSFRGTKFRGVTILEYPDAVNISCMGKDSNDDNVVYFASTGDGYVYKMDSGTSFDGEEIECRLETAYYHYGTPNSWKKFINMVIELGSKSDITLNYKFRYDYRDGSLPIGNDRSDAVSSPGDKWGEEVWGVLVWAASSTTTNRVRPYIKGLGTNMSCAFWVSSSTAQQHTIQNMTVVYEKLERQL